MENLIKELNMSESDRTKAIHIERYLPDTLFMDNYDLVRHFTQSSTPGEWETFLNTPEIRIYMDAKRNNYLRHQGFKALHSLTQNKHLTTSDVAAAKAMIEQSGILDKDQQDTVIFVTHIPAPDPEQTDAYVQNHGTIPADREVDLLGKEYK